MSRRRTWRPGHDRMAVRHPGTTGTLRAPDGSSAIVVGAGVAGLAAATGLAERGVRVTLLEREPQLGGRVRAWPLPDLPAAPSSEPLAALPTVMPGRTMSRGFHAFFRQYYNLRALLRRADPALERLRPIADYPLISADGLTDSFARIPRTPPLSFISFVAQSPSFTARDLARVDVSAALELLAVSFPDTFGSYDGESAEDFLDRLRFPPAARHLALEVFARSFFAHPSDFSAGELVAMFHTYFLGSAEGLLFDVPVDDYDTALWAPLGHYLHELGVETRTGVSVEDLSIDEERATVRLDDGTSVGADACVLAADPATTRFLGTRCGFVTDIGDEPAANWREQLAATRIAPPFAVWRLWLDRPVRSDRPAFLGTSGFGPLDNVSVLERFEDGAAGWHRDTGGSVVEVHAYALSSEMGDQAAQEQTKEQLRAELSRVYPEAAVAQVVAEEWLVRDDCPLVGTGPWQLRPGVETPDWRLVLAGDGVRCDFPVALMERAATTGFQAANALLGRWGTAGHDLWTVPMTGRRPLGRVAAALTR
jgi:isorenieratene synthase